MNRREFLHNTIVGLCVGVVGCSVSNFIVPNQPSGEIVSQEVFLKRVRDDLEAMIRYHAAFEPNDRATRKKVDDVCRPYLKGLAKAYPRNLSGFLFRCNCINNTPEIIDKQQLKVWVLLMVPMTKDPYPVRGVNWIITLDSNQEVRFEEH